MNKSEWLERFLETVSNCSREGKEAADYIRAHQIKVDIKRARKSVGAFWTLTRRIFLNSAHYTRESSLEDPNAWTLLIHEARHLQQGALVALSIYGELDAWQYEFRVYKKLTEEPLQPVLEELLSLPLNMERKNLRRARELMTQHAGKMYGANWLPLYPINKEIRYWLTRMQDQVAS